MKFRNIKSIILLFSVAAFILSACQEEDPLAYGVVESPVLAMFDGSDFSDDATFSATATFYELDKSGILDKNVGIDSIPLAGLQVKIFINEVIELGTFTTDDAGQIIFSDSKDILDGASRLEWTGSHKSVNFRVYQKF